MSGAMLMYVAQFLIMLATIWGNIYFKWTPNPVAAGVLGIMLALGFTLLVMKIKKLASYLRRRKRPAEPDF